MLRDGCGCTTAGLVGGSGGTDPLAVPRDAAAAAGAEVFGEGAVVLAGWWARRARVFQSRGFGAALVGGVEFTAAAAAAGEGGLVAREDGKLGFAFQFGGQGAEEIGEGLGIAFFLVAHRVGEFEDRITGAATLGERGLVAADDRVQGLEDGAGEFGGDGEGRGRHGWDRGIRGSWD